MAEQIQYREAIVTFIDILGFEDMIINYGENEIYEILQLFHSQYSQNSLSNHAKLGRTYTSEVYFFSDSVVRVKYTDYEDLWLNTATDEVISLAVIQLELLKRNIHIRGGCTKGMIYSDSSSNILFGPALNEAYKIESELSVYPRIVISEDVMGDYFKDMSSTISWIKNDGGTNREIKLKTTKPKYTNKGWKKDARILKLKYDKSLKDQWFINHFWGPATFYIDELSLSKNFYDQMQILHCKNELESFIEICLSLFENYNRLIEIEDTNERIKIKYLWCRFQLHETIKDIYEWVVGFKLSPLINQDVLRRLAELSELFFNRYTLK